MSRATAIGAVIVASGILVGGSIISVYAINSSVVAEDAPHAVIQNVALVTTPAPAAATTAAAAGPTIGPEDLTVTSSDDELVVPVVPDPLPAQTSANRAASPTTLNAANRQRAIGASAAQRVVTRATGGRLLATWVTQHNGLTVYAVKVQRGDGSVVVGYVDRSNGTVVDWARVSVAPGNSSTRKPTTSRPTTKPKPKPRPSASSPQSHSAEPESDEPTVAPASTAPAVSVTPTPRPSRHHTTTRRPSTWSTGSFGSPRPSSEGQWTPEPSSTEAPSSDQSDD